VNVSLYFDVHVPSAIADWLRLRGVDVLTAQEDGAAEFEDPTLQDRATELQRIPVTQDEDFLREASRRHRAEEPLFLNIFDRLIIGLEFFSPGLFLSQLRQANRSERLSAEDLKGAWVSIE
jgi:hypothetical protein